MFENTEGFTLIDGFRIPKSKAEEYKRTRDKMAEEAKKFFLAFCEIVRKEPLQDLRGEGIVGYSSTGEKLVRVALDPYELAAMNVALERHKLKEYILAANGYDEDDYQSLLSEFEERKQKKGKKVEKS